MKVSELVAALSKVQQFAGDIPVVLKAIEGEAETFVHTLDISLDPTADATSSTVTINHGTSAPTTPAATTPGPAATPSA